MAYQDYYHIIKEIKQNGTTTRKRLKDLLSPLPGSSDRDIDKIIDLSLSDLYTKNKILRSRHYPREYKLCPEIEDLTLHDIIRSSRSDLGVPKDFPASHFCILEELRCSRKGMSANDLVEILGMRRTSISTILSKGRRVKALRRIDYNEAGSQAIYAWTGCYDDAISAARETCIRPAPSDDVPENVLERRKIVGTIPPPAIQALGHKLESLGEYSRNEQLEVLRRYMRCLGYVTPRKVLIKIRNKEIY